MTKNKEWVGSHDNEPITGCAISPNGSILATIGQDECLKFWRMFETKDQIKIIKKTIL